MQFRVYIIFGNIALGTTYALFSNNSSLTKIKPWLKRSKVMVLDESENDIAKMMIKII